MDIATEMETPITSPSSTTSTSTSTHLEQHVPFEFKSMSSKLFSLMLSISDEHWISILQYLDHRSLLKMSQVSRTFYRLSNDRFLWQRLLRSERQQVMVLPPNFDLSSPKQTFQRRRDYSTITEALASLVLGKRETLLLAPGVYKENLVIDKPVDIIGEGRAATDVLIESSLANTLVISAQYGSINNVAVSQSGHWFTIDIEQGGFTISKCDITNHTLSAVKVGKNAAPWITENLIHDCKEAGIAVFGGEGTICGNVFTGNRYGSVEIVYATAKPIVKMNRIYRNKGYGIHVHSQAGGIISENIIEENDSDGISCWGNASPTVVNNRIFNNFEDGIYIHEDGKGVYEHNLIYGQKLDGIRISRSNPQISNNIIHHNQGDGIRLVIRANPIITENHICENRRVGIHIYREGQGIISNNFIYGNMNAGMQVYTRALTIITNNKIVDNTCAGIYVSDYATVEIKSNEISNNGETGVEIYSGSKALVFQNNIIRKNRETGLAFYQDSMPNDFETINNFSANGPEGNVQYIERVGRETMSQRLKNIKNNSAPGELEPVSYLVERALQASVCTLTYTRQYYHPQHWYECKTCSEPRKILGRSEIAICEECAKKCHAGHDIGVRKYGHFYCDCGQQHVYPCKSIPDDYLRSQPAPYDHINHHTHEPNNLSASGCSSVVGVSSGAGAVGHSCCVSGHSRGGSTGQSDNNTFVSGSTGAGWYNIRTHFQ
ncbi:hypothetical protein SAMD00019534_023980 [Acytostelium subglobosum LB1]|uniref:hypothetical protein n=1 Tax=Acytostelium subglobosum LB1 TaxID=1410327 RepID=UPI00064499E9|nr:hypothetical protein SAMD00019534_023980 [Acytostelium subglobosum LB1]GAM19223.1 hypothetical protein SAMD00019534_023980 [Acytostelium subglobosum LB1]|eukprot:XP_012757150.1 hypothetical protein SAMD00019534_023980 [Acytostelium subglobosum LB1]